MRGMSESTLKLDELDPALYAIMDNCGALWSVSSGIFESLAEAHDQCASLVAMPRTAVNPRDWRVVRLVAVSA